MSKRLKTAIAALLVLVAAFVAGLQFVYPRWALAKPQSEPAGFSQQRISVEEWKHYRDQVFAMPGAEISTDPRRKVTSVRLRCRATCTAWFVFTEPGHPAYPAVSRMRAEFDNRMSAKFPRNGYFAGDEAAYRNWGQELGAEND